MEQDNASQTLKGKRLHKDVVQHVVRQYQAGFYEEAAFNAFKVVDQRLRAITGKTDANPLELVNEVLHPSMGMLRDDQALQSEREGFYMLVKGAFLSFRNPPAHRFISLTEEEAFDLIVLANYIYLHVEQANQRRLAQGITMEQVPRFQYRSTYNQSFPYQLDADNDGEAETVLAVNRHDSDKVIEIFDNSPNGTVPVEVETIPEKPPWIEDVVLVDVDNDNLNELMCLCGWDAGSALLFYKFRNGRYEVLREASSGGVVPWFVDAQVTDVDGDGQLEVVSEPWGSIPDDLFPANRNRDDYDWGRVRYLYRWSRARDRFELLERKLLYVGGR